MLPPSVYDQLQTFINKDFSVSFNYFHSRMGMKPGDSVLDIGCGTGLISKRFTEVGIKYVGIDFSEERIRRARELNPDADFICGDLRDSYVLKDKKVKYVILHGVIHHLSDVEVKDLYNFLKESGCIFVGTFDPIMPTNKWAQPLATLLCKMDEGNFVREYSQYKTLFQSLSGKEVDFLRYKTIRWPVQIGYSISRLNDL